MKFRVVVFHPYGKEKEKFLFDTLESAEKFFNKLKPFDFSSFPGIENCLIPKNRSCSYMKYYDVERSLAFLEEAQTVVVGIGEKQETKYLLSLVSKEPTPFYLELQRKLIVTKQKVL